MTAANMEGTRTIRLATRRSELALRQAEWVAQLLRDRGQLVELVHVVTRGDVDRRPFQEIGEQGLFTKAVQDELLEGRADLAVHSYKDLPSKSPPGLTIAAVPVRANPLDVLLVRPHALDENGGPVQLRPGARVGTSAVRRQEQLAHLRPDLVLLDLRGNVPTRVKKLLDGEYDAIVVAAAGLERLGLEVPGVDCFELHPNVLMPAPAQGALALEIRTGDNDLANLLASLNSETDSRLVRAERDLMARFQSGCQLALGAHAVAVGGRVRLTAWFDGRRTTVEHTDPVQCAALAFQALQPVASPQEDNHTLRP